MCQLPGMKCNIPTDVCFFFTGFQNRGGETSQANGINPRPGIFLA